MPIRIVPQVSTSCNGARAFVLQCKRIDFAYCDWAGSSRGMTDFLKTRLPAFAKENPQIEMTVSNRPHKHPIVRGKYSRLPFCPLSIEKTDNKK